MGGGKTPSSSQQQQHQQQQQQQHNVPINLTKSDDNAQPNTSGWQAGGPSGLSRPAAVRPPTHSLVLSQTSAAKQEGVALMGHPVLTVNRSAVGVQGGNTIALMAPYVSRPAAPAHGQPTYHVARGSSSAMSSPRVMGAQAVRVGPLPISSIVATGGHTVSYQVSHRGVTPPSLPAGMVVPVTSIGGQGQPLLLRAAPAAPGQGGGKAGKLATVTMTAAGVRAGGPARVTVGHTGAARTVSPQARLVSPGGSAGARPLHITHISAEKLPRALAGAPQLRQTAPLTYSMLPSPRLQQLRGAVHPLVSLPAPSAAFTVTTSSAGDRGEALPLTLKTGMAVSGPVSRATPAGHQITMTVPWSTAGQQGAKVITQPAHGPTLQLPQFVPVPAGSSRPAAASAAAPAAAAAPAPAAIISAAIPVAKVLPQQQPQQPLPSTSHPGREPALSSGPALQAGSREPHPSLRTPAAQQQQQAAAGRSHPPQPPPGPAAGEPPRPLHGSPQLAATDGRPPPAYGIPASVVYEQHGSYSPARPAAVSGAGMVPGRLGGPAEPRLQLQPPSSHSVRMTSPRPSILRKRDSEMTPGRVVRNLAQQLSGAVGGGGSPPASPRRPHSSGHSSSTISASSSPGEPVGAEPMDECGPLQQQHGYQPPAQLSQPPQLQPAAAAAGGPSAAPQQLPIGLSPRKKPRKQNLASAAAATPPAPFPSLPFDARAVGSDEEMEYIRERMRPPAAPHPSTSRAAAAETSAPATSAPAPAAPAKRPVMSLLNSHGVRTWKSATNHFVKYSDVRVRDERRPTIADLASQRHIAQKINGWKIHHISGQMDELADVERTAHRRLTELLRASERMSFSRREDKEITKLNELIKGNVQRSKILRDQLNEAKVQITSVFEHKENIQQAIERYGRKRPVRKRDRR